MTLLGGSEVSLAATTPCRLQLCTLYGSSAGKIADPYNTPAEFGLPAIWHDITRNWQRDSVVDSKQMTSNYIDKQMHITRPKIVLNSYTFQRQGAVIR